MLVRFAVFLLALLIPGGFIVLVVAWLGRKLLGRHWEPLRKAWERRRGARKAPGQLPPSEVALRASFDSLVRYVESPEGAWVLKTPGSGLPPGDPSRAARAAELLSLYHWWKSGRLTEDQVMLYRLAKVHKSMFN